MSIFNDFPYEPERGFVIVELADSSYGDVAVPDKKYDTKTNGVVVAIAGEEPDYILGRRIFFDEYQDGVRVEHDDHTFAFIKVEEIRGSELTS